MNLTKELSSRNISEKELLYLKASIIAGVRRVRCVYIHIFGASCALLFHKWMIQELFHFVVVAAVAAVVVAVFSFYFFAMFVFQ